VTEIGVPVLWMVGKPVMDAETEALTESGLEAEQGAHPCVGPGMPV
jgi:hypothetical protein